MRRLFASLLLPMLAIGCTPPGQDCKYAPSNHSPRFYVDEAGLKVGVRAMTTLALEWLARPHTKA